MSGGLAKPLRTAPGAHSVQLSSKPSSAQALHWHLARDHILRIYAHSATQKEHCCSSSQPQVSTAYSLLVLHNYSVFVLFALVQAGPHSHALSGQDRLRRAGRLRQISQDSMRTSRRLPGPQTRVSCCTFQGSLCTVVAVHSLRSLESAELYVFITQQLPRISCWIPSTST